MVTFPVFVTTNEYDTRSPTRPTVVRFKLFVTDNPGADAIVTTPAEEPSDTVRAGAVPPAGVGACPEAPAVLVTRPRSTSACVTTYDPVHVNVPPGATGCPTVGHVTVNAEPAISSTTRTSDNATSPVFVTTNEYDTRSPARDTVAGVALFTTDNPGPTATAR